MQHTRLQPAPLVLAIALALGLPLAHAQSVTAGTTPVAVDIAAQPLGSALNELARQTGLELAVQPQAVAGKTAPAVSGRLTAGQALDRLLAGSGLRGGVQGSAVVVTPATATRGEATLSAVTVTASADASAAGLSPAYAGGQVARGGRVGILGTQDNMETPFSITSYTNELIQNQQARSVADVLQNDPSVRIARGYGNFQESYFIRGFILGSDDIAYNGLYGLMPRQYTSAELFERVEVLRGASAFLTGATPTGSGIGGTVNLLPKRAPNEPLSQVTLGAGSDSQLYAATDLARRFGPDNSTGIRINAAHRRDGSGVDDEASRLDVLSLGLDWRSARARLSADVGFQNNKLEGTRPNVTVAGLSAVPAAPSASTNYAQPWTHSDERDIYATARGEYDLTDQVTAWAAVGSRKGHEDNRLAGVTVTNPATGDATAYRFDNRREDVIKTGEAGLRSKFDTGPVSHTLTASASYYELKERNAYAMDFFNTFPTNIYNPVDVALPAISGTAFTGGDLANPGPLSTVRMTSMALGDTASMLDGKLLLTGGLRYQRLSNTSYDYISSLNGEVYAQHRATSCAGMSRCTPTTSRACRKASRSPATTPTRGRRWPPSSPSRRKSASSTTAANSAAASPCSRRPSRARRPKPTPTARRPSRPTAKTNTKASS